MNQSQKIRGIILDIFKSEDEKELKQTVLIDGFKREGIKYKDLKDRLLTCDEQFSEGGVTGALQTLTERLENIYKVKTKKGVFFFYSENDEIFLNSDNAKMIITESEDFQLLEEKVEGVSSVIASILKNASKGKYASTKDSDLKHLRKLLSVSSELQNVLSNYKIDKTFEKIEDDPFGELPF